MDDQSASQENDIDLTNAHLSNLDDVELPDSLTSLDLTANRLRTIPQRILELTGLISLCLRQNLLHDADVISLASCAPVLQELSLQDNSLQKIPDLSHFASLRRLELSYNKLRDTGVLQSVHPVGFEELYVANNLLTHLQGLSHLSDLRLLDAGSNRIKSMEGIESCISLKELWLGRNRITEILQMERLSSLEKLSLQSNRLQTTAGIGEYCHLQELYLSHNGLTALQGLAELTSLQILDLGNNFLSSIIPLSEMKALTEIWINDNKLDDLNGVLSCLQVQRQRLKCIYLMGNPLAENEEYKDVVRAAFPHLEQLDADYLVAPSCV